MQDNYVILFISNQVKRATQRGWCWSSTWFRAASWPPLPRAWRWPRPPVSPSRPSWTSSARARWPAPSWTRNAKASPSQTWYTFLSPCVNYILLNSRKRQADIVKRLMNPLCWSLSDILQGNFKPDYYLKHIQKDLRLAISMGDMANHPTPMAAAANEVRQ